jgi:hypothetical protein
MQKFLKDNIVLVLGISLPVALVIIFILASALPKFFVANPQYDFLFSDSQYSKLEFIVINQRIHFRVFPERPNNLAIRYLYRYIAATDKVQEVAFTLPNMPTQKTSTAPNNINTNIVVSVDPHNLPSAQQARDVSKVVSEIRGNEVVQPTTIPVVELANIKIDSSLIAPDGYAFTANSRPNNGGILLSASSSGKPGVMIAKSGRNVPILYNKPDNGYYHYPIFIGWIIP